VKIAQALQAWGTNLPLTSSPAGTAETTLEQNLHKGDAVPFVLVVPPENPAITDSMTPPPPDRGCGESQAAAHGEQRTPPESPRPRGQQRDNRSTLGGGPPSAVHD